MMFPEVRRRLRWAPLVLSLPAVPACDMVSGLDEFELSSESGASASGAGGSNTGGSTGVGTVGGAGGQGGAVCDSAAPLRGTPLVRHFINEGEGIILNSAPGLPDFPLTISQGDNDPTWVVETSHSALSWSTIQGSGKTSAQNLNQILPIASSALTIEAVVRVVSVSNGPNVEDSSRILYVGSPSGEVGIISLGVRSVTPDGMATQFSLAGRRQSVNLNEVFGCWSYRLPTTAPMVVHVVFTTGAMGVKADLYVDGVAQDRSSMIGCDGPGDDMGFLSFSDGDWYVLGNRQAGGSSFGGSVYYAAVYGVALDPGPAGEIMANVDRLLCDDDS